MPTQQAQMMLTLKMIQTLTNLMQPNKVCISCPSEFRYSVLLLAVIKISKLFDTNWSFKGIPKNSYSITEPQSAEDLGVKLAEYNFTDSFTITDLKPEKTLEGSQLVKINVKEASEDEITKTFCREVNL